MYQATPVVLAQDADTMPDLNATPSGEWVEQQIHLAMQQLDPPHTFKRKKLAQKGSCGQCEKVVQHGNIVWICTQCEAPLRSAKCRNQASGEHRCYGEAPQGVGQQLAPTQLALASTAEAVQHAA
jgi:hypothetical protein